MYAIRGASRFRIRPPLRDGWGGSRRITASMKAIFVYLSSSYARLKFCAIILFIAHAAATQPDIVYALPLGRVGVGLDLPRLPY
jgi:hypothetical protein